MDSPAYDGGTGAPVSVASVRIATGPAPETAGTVTGGVGGEATWLALVWPSSLIARYDANGTSGVFSDQLPSGPVATWASVFQAVLAPGGRNCSSTSWAPPGRTWPHSVRRATSIQNGSLKCAKAGFASPAASNRPDCQPVNDLPCAGSSCQAYWLMSCTRGSRQAR